MAQISFPMYARCKVMWTIDQFTPTMLTDIHSDCYLKSPRFLVPFAKTRGYSTAGHTAWHLYVDRNRSCLSCYLVPATSIVASYTSNQLYKSYDKLAVVYKVGILTSEGTVINQTRGTAERWTYGTHYGGKIGRLFNFKEITTNNKNALNNKKITIVVRLDFVERPTFPTAPTSMSTAYENLFDNDKFSDFKLRTSDGKEIFVHKNILSTRSPVFNTMMMTKMLERKENKATITDIGSGALIEFVRFIYSGRVEAIDDIAHELLYAATKYDVPDLKPLCVLSLTKTLSDTNVLDTLILADLHGENDLKDFCIDFVKWNYEELNESNNSWEQLPSSLFKKILDVALPFSENSIIKITSHFPVKIETRASLPAHVAVGLAAQVARP